jgi:hypothetical protein
VTESSLVRDGDTHEDILPKAESIESCSQYHKNSLSRIVVTHLQDTHEYRWGLLVLRDQKFLIDEKDEGDFWKREGQKIQNNIPPSISWDQNNLWPFHDFFENLVEIVEFFAGLMKQHLDHSMKRKSEFDFHLRPIFASKFWFYKD